MRIRPARAADLPQLIRLEQSTFPEDCFNPAQIKYLLTRARGVVLVAEQEKRLVGAAYLLWRQGGRTGRLYSIAVSEAVRGQGVAPQLLKRGEQEVQRHGCTKLSLEVRADNERAIAFYRKHGYREIARLPDYYELGSDGVKMLRELAAH
ncbi:MAG: N-acetyltransferase [bacterium]